MTPEQIENGDYNWVQLAEFLGYETNPDHGRINQAVRNSNEKQWHGFAMYRPYGKSDLHSFFKTVPEGFDIVLKYNSYDEQWECSIYDADGRQGDGHSDKSAFHASFAAYFRLKQDHDL